MVLEQRQAPPRRRQTLEMFSSGKLSHQLTVSVETAHVSQREAEEHFGGPAVVVVELAPADTTDAGRMVGGASPERGLQRPVQTLVERP